MKYLILFLLVPSIALATWEVEVLDKQTREVKKYQLADNEEFIIPLNIKDVFCFSPPQKTEYREQRFIYSRNIQCDHFNFSIFETHVKIIGIDFEIPVSFTIFKNKKEFFIVLRYI